MNTLKALAVAIGIGLMGCGPSLAQGEIGAGAPVASRIGSVYMLRGFMGISGGLEQVVAELNGLGVRAAAYEHPEWSSIAEAIKAQYAAGGEHEPIIIVGYSLGGNDAIQLCRELGAAGIPVDLLITLDPTTPDPVPPNVLRAVDLFQHHAGISGSPLQADPGFRGELINHDLSGLPDIQHHNFPMRPEVSREIVAQVLQVARPRAVRPVRPSVRRGRPHRG